MPPWCPGLIDGIWQLIFSHRDSCRWAYGSRLGGDAKWGLSFWSMFPTHPRNDDNGFSVRCGGGYLMLRLTGIPFRKAPGAEHGAARAPAWECGLNALEWRNVGVDNVHTFRFGSGRTGAGLGRIAYVFGSSQCLQGLECGSSPTSGTVFSLFSGFLALECA
jgi:hypothetical protein